jgi:hypothetical protein
MVSNWSWVKLWKSLLMGYIEIAMAISLDLTQGAEMQPRAMIRLYFPHRSMQTAISPRLAKQRGQP